MISDEAKERAHQLRELTQHPGWPLLSAMAEERVHYFQRRLIDGQAEDYAQYRAWAAFAAGMLDVFEIPERAMKAAEE